MEHWRTGELERVCFVTNKKCSYSIWEGLNTALLKNAETNRNGHRDSETPPT